MDHFAAEKEAARAELSSVKSQLRCMKEKSSAQAKKIKELEARLASELAKAKSEVEKAKAEAEAIVAVYRVDAEAAQVQAREVAETAQTQAHWIAEFVKYQSRRETLEEIHARGFDLTNEIIKAKEHEANAKALASSDDDDDDDDGSKSGSENGETFSCPPPMASSSKRTGSSKNKIKNEDYVPPTDAQPVDAVTPAEDDVSALWGEFDLVENANSHSRAPIVMPSTARQSTGSLPSLAGEHPTTSANFDADIFRSSPLLALTPLSSPPSAATSFLSSSTFLPTISFPTAAPDRAEGVPLPQSPLHWNLGQNYAAPSEDPQRRRSVTLSVSIGCNLLSRPVELANYLKPLASEKDWEKIQTLLGECLLNNAMHNAAAANFLASEGLHRFFREKEELSSERDRLLVERDQTVLRLSELEIRVAEVVALEARLQQSEHEDAILDANDREAAAAERITDLEAALNSKAEELAATRASHALLEEKSAQDNLSVEITQIKEELRRREASLIVEKTHAMYNMRRKILEVAKGCIIDIDAKIAKAHELELAAKNGLPAQSDAPGSFNSGSDIFDTEEESEGNDAEDPVREDVEPSVAPPTAPGDMDTSLPPDSSDVVA
ncbi:uncharacterized protein [Nicotiana tomentosiformis]|uniref:uncharacterized protein n=1 Tax=Nicotiana tomentosiformis TaxID=4098 RepID=UPI00388C5DA9